MNIFIRASWKPDAWSHVECHDIFDSSLEITYKQVRVLGRNHAGHLAFLVLPASPWVSDLIPNEILLLFAQSYMLASYS